VKQLLQSIHDFLTANDSATLLDAYRKVEWSQVARSPYTWFIILPLVIYLFWTKKYKIITAIVSFVLFLVLLQRTVASSSEMLSLHDLLIFVSGTVVLIGVNLYLIFVRQ
jgi:hypothetical protein